MLKRIVLFGWALLIIGSILIVEFPNSPWNHAASEVLWITGIGVFMLTSGFVVLTAARLIGKVMRPTKGTAVHRGTAAPELSSETRGSGRLVLGSGVIVAIATFVASLLLFVEHEIKSSDVFAMSLARAQQSSDVLRILGEPVKPGWLVTGEIAESTNGGGHATLRIPLDGPRAHGTLHVEAERRSRGWQFYTFQLTTKDNSSAVDLLGHPSDDDPRLR